MPSQSTHVDDTIAACGKDLLLHATKTSTHVRYILFWALSLLSRREWSDAFAITIDHAPSPFALHYPHDHSPIALFMRRRRRHVQACNAFASVRGIAFACIDVVVFQAVIRNARYRPSLETTLHCERGQWSVGVAGTCAPSASA